MDISSPPLEATRRRLVARFGTEVEPWWEMLPDTLAELAQRWKLAVGDPIGRGNTSLVIRCRRAGGDAAVLKLTPEAAIARAEAAALRQWEPCGRVPRVWGYDSGSGALLLEAIPDETPLSERRAGVALAAVADLIGGLHGSGSPVGADGVVPLVARVDFVFEHWIQRHGRRGEAAARPVPLDRLRRGHELARRLAADPCAPVLLHGDLHPANVLDGGADRGLVAIDPRPCVGDPAFDLVDWVFWTADDPAAWTPRSRSLARAVGLDHERVWAWCGAFAAMLAASEAGRGASEARVAALLALSP